ncbi:MAG: DUF2959 family protein [Bryobacteraceae bacterium]
MKKLGKEKRDILAKRVDASRKDQEEAKKQFQTALEAFQALTGFDGGNLEEIYKKLNKEYERTEDRAKDVSNRIESIEQVAGDMFKEWDNEIDEMRNSDLKNRSRALRREAEKRYRPLIARMRASETKMKPVLGAFRDQVLFLKHNLNAKAIASLKQTAIKMDGEVAVLVKEIEASIQEADAFIATLGSES